MTIPYYCDLDLSLFLALNSTGDPFLDALFTFLSNRWFGIGLGLLTVAWFIYRRKWDAVCIAVAMILAVGLSDFLGSQLLKPLFARMRPCYALPEGTFRWVLHAANVGSLPSLHAANLFAYALVSTRADRRLAWFAYPIACLVGFSRIYVGVHWPSDVLAGAAWGTLVALAVWWSSGRVEGWIKRRRQARRESRPAKHETMTTGV